MGCGSSNRRKEQAVVPVTAPVFGAPSNDHPDHVGIPVKPTVQPVQSQSSLPYPVQDNKATVVTAVPVNNPNFVPNDRAFNANQQPQPYPVSGITVNQYGQPMGYNNTPMTMIPTMPPTMGGTVLYPNSSQPQSFQQFSGTGGGGGGGMPVYM